MTHSTIVLGLDLELALFWIMAGHSGAPKADAIAMFLGNSHACSCVCVC